MVGHAGVGRSGINLEESDLARLARIAGRLLAGRPGLSAGPRPDRSRAGQGLEFLDYREHAPGDDLRQVDWRASARRQHLLVRRHHDELGTQWCVCLDASASMGTPTTDKWTLAVQLAAAFAYMLNQLGHRVGLIRFSDAIEQYHPPGHGHANFAQLMTMLRAGAPPVPGRRSNLGSCLRMLSRRVSVVVISDFLVADAMTPDLRRMQQLGGAVHAIQVLAHNELQVPDNGELTLRDAETNEQLALRLDDYVRDLVRKRLRDHNTELARACRRNHISLTSANTTHTWKDIVIRHLQCVAQAHV